MKPIPFRERLVVRLAVGMIGVALLSLLLTFILQFISISLSDIQPPKLEKRMQDIVAQYPDDEDLQVLAETPFRIRRIIARTGLLSLVFSGVLWIYFAIRFSRSIAKPIEDVTLASAQITNGDLGTRVQMSKNAKGEPARLLEYFNEMATSLETYEQERTEMIASIAHELRTPLAVTRSRLELMEEGLVELNQDEVTRMSRQIDLLTRLVNDLRTLSLADANKLSLNLASVAFDEVTRNVAESLQSRVQEQGITLELSLEPHVLQADADRLTQVVFNLLDNALKHTPKEGRINVSLKRVNKDLILTIQDTGGGFHGDAEQLFKRFYTTQESVGSSGIGLALVKTITDLHGGHVSAQNAAQGGAVFTVHLPAIN